MLSRRFRPGASIARGRPPRQIGQMPEPTISRGMAHISLPPGGRWHAKRDGRRPRDFKFSQISWYRALPHPTSSGAPSRREPFVKPLPTEKHHQRNFLGGVRYFSANNAEASRCLFEKKVSPRTPLQKLLKRGFFLFGESWF